MNRDRVFGLMGLIGGVLLFVFGWDLRSGWPFQWDVFSVVRDPVLVFYPLAGGFLLWAAWRKP